MSRPVPRDDTEHLLCLPIVWLNGHHYAVKNFVNRVFRCASRVSLLSLPGWGQPLSVGGPPRQSYRRSQDFCLEGTRPKPPNHASVVHTFEAVADSWGSVSALVVSRVMGGAPELNKNSKRI